MLADECHGTHEGADHLKLELPDEAFYRRLNHARLESIHGLVVRLNDVRFVLFGGGRLVAGGGAMSDGRNLF